MRRAAVFLCAAALYAQTPRLPSPVKPGQSSPSPGGKGAASDIPKLPDIPVLPGAPVAQPAAQPVAPPKTVNPDTSLGLRPGPPKPFAASAAKEMSLPNGLRVTVLETPGSQWVSGALVVKAGTLADPADRTGLAELTLRALPADPARVDQLGAQLTREVAETASTISFRCLSDKLDDMLAIAAKMVVNSVPEQDALDSARGGLRTRVATRNNDPATAMARELTRLVLGPGPATARLEFDPLASIGTDDAQAFLRKWYVPRNTALVLTGGVDASQVQSRIASLFGQWKGGEAPAAIRSEATGAAPSGIVTWDAPRVPASLFMMGRVAPRMDQPNAAAGFVLAELLGGASNNSRMARLSRRQPSWGLRGNAIYDGSVARPGMLAIRAVTDTAYAVEAIRGLHAEFAALNRAIDDADFDDARVRAASGWAARFTRASSRLVYDHMAEGSGLGPGHSAKFLAAISAVTRADVQKAAKELLDPAAFHMIVLTNSGLLTEPLTTLRPTLTPIDLTIAAPKPMEARVDSAAIAEGKALLAKMQQALGGAAKLAAVKDLRVEYEGRHIGYTTKVVDRWLAPNLFRQDQETNGRQATVYYDGDIGWLGYPGRVGKLSAGMLLQARHELFRAWPALALSDRDPKRTVVAIASNVLLIRGEFGVAARIVLDADTSLPLRIGYQSVDPSDTPAMNEDVITEWREVEGVKYPGRVITRQDGARLGDLTVGKIEVNTGIKAEELAKKP